MSGEFLKRQAVIDLALGWRGPMAAKAAAAPKPRLDIEALLAWAYLTELPKTERMGAFGPPGLRSAWAAVEKWRAELSLAVARDNAYGCVPDYYAADTPHNDALLVHEAVCALDVLEVEGLDGCTPFEPRDDVDQSLLDRCALRVRDRVLTVLDGKPRLRNPLRNLVFHSAILGGSPEWRIGDFVQDVERWDNGAVKYFKKGGYWEKGASGDVWVGFETAVALRNGFRHDPDLIERPILSPDPTDEAVSRVNYELWRLALDVLAADLSGRLEKWDVVESALPHRPWVEGVARGGRILPDLTRRPIRIVRGGQKKIAGTA